jgi:hypothetical protein
MTEPEQTPPPDGLPPDWEQWNGGSAPGAAPPPPPRGMPDLQPLYEMLAILRRSVPPELQGQINSLQREVLLTLRALIDWYLERLEAPDRAPAVEDIPID